MFKKEREHKQREGAEGEGEAGSPLSKEPEDMGLDPRTPQDSPGPRDHDLSQRQTLNQGPCPWYFKYPTKKGV